MKRRGFLKVLGVVAPVAAVAPKILEQTPAPAKDSTDLFFSPKTEVYEARNIRVPLQLRPGGRFGHFNPEGGELSRGSSPTYEIAYMTESEYRHFQRRGSVYITEGELAEFRRRGR